MIGPTRSNRRSEFERLLLPHRLAAFNLAMWLTSSRADADDIVQDAYVRAWRAFDQIRGGSPRAWLLTIVRNTAYRHLQTRNRMFNVISIDDGMNPQSREGVRPLDIADETPDAEALAIRDSDKAALLAALAKLPIVLREAIVLREMEGLSYREIAAVMETPIGTVMSRLSRARAELRKVLIEHQEGGSRAL